ncbi:MAG: DUF6351 family protein [Bauldia sp.]
MVRKSWVFGASLAALCALGSTAALAQAKLAVEVLSSRPELVTGGSALVKVTGAAAAPTVAVDGKDVSAAFKADGKGGFVGLVEGLKDGDNQLVAKATGGDASVTLVNHPINGGLFETVQQDPFLCENEAHGLAPAKDATCAAPTVVTYYYRNTKGEWKVFDPAATRPTDIGTTKTTEGATIPIIYRQEKGVINRSAFIISIPHDPAAGPLPTPTAKGGSGWNGKLVYVFGGGVQPNFHMGRGFGMTGNDPTLGNKYFLEDLGSSMGDNFVNGGYAFLQGSLNVMGTNNDTVKSGETMAKVKEQFIKEYGPPVYTIGHGASGGSMQQHVIANRYPGLFDGIMPMRSYPDVMSFLQPLYDCELLVNVTKSGNWTRPQLDAISGKYWGYCISNGTRYPNARVDDCDAAVKDLVTNDPRYKTAGVRCTYQDNLVQIFGKDPKTGAARNPFDNVGVQYGLKALNDGKITMAQFIDINGRIGGHDADGKIVPQRQVGDATALKIAYETGEVNAGEGLRNVAIMDMRSFVDGDFMGRGDPNVDVHDGYHTAVMGARLQKANGTQANRVVLTAASLGTTQLDTRTVDSPLRKLGVDGFAQMDKWLTAVANDSSNKTRAEKIIANKPAGFVDTCAAAVAGPWVGVIDTATNKWFGAVDRITDQNRCKQLFAFAASPRIAAGGPATDDNFKCALKPVDVKDYKVAPTAEELAQLQKIFADGVCDYSKPAVGQAPLAGTWAIYTNATVKYLSPVPSK